MYAIETKNLTRRYGSLTAVDSLNLQVPSGSLFGLIGPNGAGKTTTMRMLAGLLDPSAGEIMLNGESTCSNNTRFRHELGYMPDFFGVYEDMLVWEYLDFFARCYNIAGKERANLTTDLLDLVGLSDKHDEYVESLSRGMRQRLCLAHALVHDPSVLLLDEPASGLDPRARVEMRELLRELGAMGKTVIVSSHILAELSELCDSVGIIESGQLVASGPIDQIALKDQAQEQARGKLLRIQTLSDSAQLHELLDAQPAVLNIYADQAQSAADHSEAEAATQQTKIEIEFDGDERATAQLLAQLVNQGILVISFAEVTSDLEDVFMRVTETASER